MTGAYLIALFKRYPLRFISAIVALLCLVGIYLISGKIEESVVVLGQKNVEGERLATNVRNAAQLREQYESLVEDGKKAQTHSIRASQLATNLQYFYRLESEAGVELLDVRQTSSGTSKNASQAVAFAVSVKAEYPVLIGYLRRLENGPYYCRILSASIGTASATGDRAGPLTLSLALELFGQP